MTTPGLPIAKGLLRASKQDTLVRVQHFGSELAAPIYRITKYLDEASELSKGFFKAGGRARKLLNEQSLEEFYRRADELLAIAEKNLSGAELKAFREEIEHQIRIMDFRALSKGLPQPRSARRRAIMPEAATTRLLLESARFEALFINHMEELAAKAAPSGIERASLTAYQRMVDAVGNQLGDGWAPVFDYCARNAQGIASAAKRLGDIETKIAHLKVIPPVLGYELLRARRRAGGYLYPIRGMLGEIYLYHWERWLVQLDSFRLLAEHDLRKLSRDWDPEPIVFSGGMRIDGKEAWDQGILLVKPPAPGDLLTRAAIHTAAQMKVSKQQYLPALLQTIKDRLRERGKGIDPPILSIFHEGKRQDFRLEVLPPEFSVHRFVFNARVGDFDASQRAMLARLEKQLDSLGMRVNQLTLDMSIEEFDALTRQIMDIAEKYLTRLKSSR